MVGILKHQLQVSPEFFKALVFVVLEDRLQECNKGIT